VNSESASGILYMIPLPVADDVIDTLSPAVAAHTERITHYFVENVRTARRFLRRLHATLVIDSITFSLIDKHHGPDVALLRTWLVEGKEVGVMSEAGCPGIADPGSILVSEAHKVGSRVIPLSGPSSLLLALMASGLNGQSFAFNGYLPVKEPARGKALKDYEDRSAKESQTQIFIETPYRNNHMLQDFIRHLRPATRLCIAMDVTGPGEKIATHTVAEWKKLSVSLEKTPAVFLFLV